MKRIKQFERTDRDITNALLLLLEKNRFEKITVAQIFVKIFYRTIHPVTFLYLTNLSKPVFCIFQKSYGIAQNFTIIIFIPVFNVSIS